MYYIDGGVGTTNPTLEAIDEVDKLHPRFLRIVASFGAGKPNVQRNLNQGKFVPQAINYATQLLRRARAALTDAEQTHFNVVSLIQRLQNADGFAYFRFNVKEGLDRVRIDEWESKRDDGYGGRCSTAEYIRKQTEKQLGVLQIPHLGQGTVSGAFRRRTSVHEESETTISLRQLAAKLVEHRRNRIESKWIQPAGNDMHAARLTSVQLRSA